MTSLRGGQFNVRTSRTADSVAAGVTAILHAHDLDFLLLQEVNSRHLDALGLIPGYRLAIWDICGTAILVRNGVKVTHARAKALGVLPWMFNGRLHPRRGLATCVLDGWLRVASVHMPPSPFTSKSRPLAYAENCRSLVRFGRHVTRPLVIAGDWNKSSVHPGPNTPSAIAGALSAAIWHVDGHPIDFPVTRGLSMTRPISGGAHEGGSDHTPIFFTVHRPARKATP